MKNEVFHLELITPCFCGGALPKEQAEIRAPSIRGQLRWWFRTLGGFKSLADQGMDWRKQEQVVFGSTAGGEGMAGKLIVKVRQTNSGQAKSQVKDADEMGAATETPKGYLLFPLRSRKRDGQVVESAARGVFDDSDRNNRAVPLPRFELHVLWRGDTALWEDVRALVGVFGHLGSLGFRGRRAMGALTFERDVPLLTEVHGRFAKPGGIVIKTVKSESPFGAPVACITALGEWLRDWRQHGQMNRQWRPRERRWEPVSEKQKETLRAKPGFKFARRDHNEGLDVQGTGAPDPDPENPEGEQGQVFRPALGLPIIQFFSSLGSGEGPVSRGRATVNWEFSRGDQKGRFASPVILRPHRVGPNQYRPLVIFVEAHAWPQGHRVHLNGEERTVSTELYEAMKNDKERLISFP